MKRKKMMSIWKILAWLLKERGGKLYVDDEDEEEEEKEEQERKDAEAEETALRPRKRWTARKSRILRTNWQIYSARLRLKDESRPIPC
jgi:hypothetical protein